MSKMLISTDQRIYGVQCFFVCLCWIKNDKYINGRKINRRKRRGDFVLPGSIFFVI